MRATATLDRRQLASLRRRILSWYRANRRDLPWRRGRDPYRIWIAEIMLQQTRIAAVLPYYERFLGRFPNVRELARARESEVLRFWSGLGYYSRARNLHRAAKQIVSKQAGHFPSTLADALALPGIGAYTSAAILSIAYDVPLAALDGNVARVLARIFAVRGDLRTPKLWRRMGAMAQRLLPPKFAADWNQALMELGETICTPRAPDCPACPVSLQCKARLLGIAHKLPAPRRKRDTAEVRIAAAVLVDARGQTLVTMTPGAHDSALFSRLWQFPAVSVASPNGSAARELSAHLQTQFHLRPVLFELAPATHTVTYRKLTLLPFLARVESLPSVSGSRAVALENLASLPVSSATRKIGQAALRALAEIAQ